MSSRQPATTTVEWAKSKHFKFLIYDLHYDTHVKFSLRFNTAWSVITQKITWLIKSMSKKVKLWLDNHLGTFTMKGFYFLEEENVTELFVIYFWKSNVQLREWTMVLWPNLLIYRTSLQNANDFSSILTGLMSKCVITEQNGGKLADFQHLSTDEPLVSQS